MFASIRKLFASNLAEASSTGTTEHYQLATAALLLEVTQADSEVMPAELNSVTQALQRAFSLDAQTLDELIQLAEAERDAATCLYSFTRSINDTLKLEDKTRIVELMWQVAYADGHLDAYEEHLVRKVADLLYIPHADYIAAKLQAQKSES